MVVFDVVFAAVDVLAVVFVEVLVAFVAFVAFVVLEVVVVVDAPYLQNALICPKNELKNFKQYP